VRKPQSGRAHRNKCPRLIYDPLDHSALTWTISYDDGATWSPYALQSEAFSAAEADPTAIYRIWIDHLPEGTENRYDEIVFGLSESTDEDGVVTYTTYRIANFTAPNYTTTLSIDVLDAHSWVQVERVFSSNGTYSERLLREDGFTEVADFAPDGLGGYTQTGSGLEDTADVRPWASTFSYYNEYQERDEQITIYDDGRFRAAYDDVQEGARYIETFDEGDAYAWTQIFARYVDGDLTERAVVFDNGVQRSTQYEVEGDGSVVSHQFSEDPEDAKDWETQEVYTVDGNVVLRRTDYDDGTEQNNGDVVAYRYEDKGNEYNWYSKSMDSEGTLESRITEYDDGVVVQNVTDNGQKLWSLSEDRFDTRNWEAQTSNYENGVLSETYRENDNGTVVQSAYAIVDGAAVLATRNITINSENQDGFVWRETNWTYDEQGQKSERSIEYVDGRVAEETYEDGMRATRTTVDHDDAYDWYQIDEQWENGTLVSREFTDDPMG